MSNPTKIPDRVIQNPKLTVIDKIIITAALIPDQIFPLERLVVESWVNFKSTFGLEDYKDLHPDSNKVSVAICGKNGMVARGYLNRVGQKVYRITKKAVDKANELTGNVVQPTDTNLTNIEVDYLTNWLGSAALYKYSTGHKSDITFQDAKEFWGPNNTGRTTTIDSSGTDSIVSSLTAKTDEDKTVDLGHRKVTGSVIRVIAHLYSFLKDKYKIRIRDFDKGVA